MTIATYEQVLSAAKAVEKEGKYQQILIHLGGVAGLATKIFQMMQAFPGLALESLMNLAKTALVVAYSLAVQLAQCIDALQAELVKRIQKQFTAIRNTVEAAASAGSAILGGGFMGRS